VALFGFDKFSREEDISRVLGIPAHSSIRGDGLEKTISYSKWNASFKIALGKVVGFASTAAISSSMTRKRRRPRPRYKPAL